jgi:uncharacterized protein YacL
MALAFLRVLVIVAALWTGGAGAVAIGASPSLGALLGLAVGVAAVVLEAAVRRAPPSVVVGVAAGGGAGLLVGLVAWTAVAPALDGATPVRVLAALLGAYLGAAVGLRHGRAATSAGDPAPVSPAGGVAPKIVDTSALIDGRLAEVCEAGFVEGTLVVPHFVVRELQRVADSSDPPRRNRGKRGFEVLRRLQRMDGVVVEIVDDDPAQAREVDLKLIEVARARRGLVITTDYNLNRVAEVSGIRVLNVNDLATALRPVALPGEAMRINVVREGKEPGQGVGFLDDGTMVVVEQGKRLIGQSVEVTVTSALQTSAGRLIFTRPREEDGEPHDG